MWPIYPDEFEPLVQPPLGDEDDADAWYFLCINGQIACVAERGVPRPITADEFRWLDVEVFSKHYLGRFGNRACYALEGRGELPEGSSARLSQLEKMRHKQPNVTWRSRIRSCIGESIMRWRGC